MGVVLEDSVKTFRGRNVAEAMGKVRAELGSDAYVLEKREIRGKKGLFKLGGEEMVEIVATNSGDVARRVDSQRQRAPRGRTLLEKTYDTSSATGLACKLPKASEEVEVELKSRERPASMPAGNNAPEDVLASTAPAMTPDFTTMMSTMRSEILRLTSIQARGGFPAVGERLLDAYQMLIENEVNASIARSIVEDLQQGLGQGALDSQTVSDGLCESVASMIRTGGCEIAPASEERPAVVTIIGPSGAGKTTTLVKLAFEMAYNQKKKVGIINEDFRRPGASAQLQGLMSILDLPLVTADSPVGLANELRNMSGLDLVLIDTAGRGPRDSKGLAELKSILEVAQSDAVHLVVNAASTERSALNCVKAYEECGFDSLIMSKLDEVPAYGLALNLARNVAQEIAYVTVGQTWTAGLQKADSMLLAKLICGVEQPLC